MKSQRRLTHAARFWLLYAALLLTIGAGTLWTAMANAQTPQDFKVCSDTACVQIIVTPVAPPCPVKPADDTRAGTCPTGTAGSWTQTQTYASVPAPACWAPGGYLPTTPPAGACVATCPPKPADETRSQSCAAGTTGSWTQTRTYASAAAPACWTAGAWLPTAAPTGACTTPPASTPTAVVICTSGTPFNQPFATCTSTTIGQPTNAQAVLYCPAVVTLGSAQPACPSAYWYNWSGIQAGSKVLTNAGWYPRSAIKVPLVAPVLTTVRSANQADPTRSNVTLTWPAVPGATAGYEIDRCTGADCSNFALLASVSGLTYANTNLPGGFTYRYRVRGADAAGKGPYSNIEAVLTPTAATGSATVMWTPPTRNTDGTTLTNLAGFRIVYGKTATDLSQTIQVANAGVSSFVVDSLDTGTWYFAVRSYTTSGAESANSNTGSKVIP